MSSDVKMIAVVLAAVAVAVVGVMAIRGTSREVVVLPPIDAGSPGDTIPSGGPVAVVVEKQETGGGGFLWFKGDDPEFRLMVQFYASGECLRAVNFDEPWPASASECASSVPISGVITGLGSVADGETLIVVATAVEEACWDAVERGDYWPPNTPACDGSVGGGAG